MTIYDLKPRFQALLRPLVRALFRMGVTANGVTLTAVLLSLLTGALTVWIDDQRVWLLVPIVLLVRMALNAIDGMLAREFRQQSRLGAILNELGDVVSDAALYLPFATLLHFGWPAVSLVVLLAAFTEFAGVLGQTIGATRRYDGPFGKSDRAFAFGVLGLAVGLGLKPAGWLQAVFPVMAVLLTWTVVNRCRRALAEEAAA